jgi:hypothetical protein
MTPLSTVEMTPKGGAMRRFAATSVCGLLLVVPVAFGSMSTAYARPAGIVAGYRLHIEAGGHPYIREQMALLENHTGYTDLDAITWSRHDGQITLVFRDRRDSTYEATYVGTVGPAGISTQRHPGTITNADGSVGVFYAVNKTRG